MTILRALGYYDVLSHVSGNIWRRYWKYGYNSATYDFYTEEIIELWPGHPAFH